MIFSKWRWCLIATSIFENSKNLHWMIFEINILRVNLGFSGCDDVLHFDWVKENDFLDISWTFYSYCYASQDSFCLVGLISCTLTVCLLIIATILLYYAIKTRRVRRELQSRSERSTVASRDMGDLARYFVDVGYVTAMRHSLPVQNEFKSTVRKKFDEVLH